MQYGSIPPEASLDKVKFQKMYFGHIMVLLCLMAILYMSWLSLDIVGPWFTPTPDFADSLSPNWHGVLMFSFFLCYTAMLLLKERDTTQGFQTNLHVAAGVLLILGLTMMIVSRLQAGLVHFAGIHSWLGLISIGMFFYLTSKPRTFPNERTEIWWGFTRWLNYALILLTVMCGLLETSYLVDFYGENHFTPQKLLPNALLCLAFFVGMLIFAYFMYIPRVENDASVQACSTNETGRDTPSSPSTALLTAHSNPTAADDDMASIMAHARGLSLSLSLSLSPI